MAPARPLNPLIAGAGWMLGTGLPVFGVVAIGILALAGD